MRQMMMTMLSNVSVQATAIMPPRNVYRLISPCKTFDLSTRPHQIADRVDHRAHDANLGPEPLDVEVRESQVVCLVQRLGVEDSVKYQAQSCSIWVGHNITTESTYCHVVRCSQGCLCSEEHGKHR
eukprot:762070-Hanusia_phi.AAC.5